MPILAAHELSQHGFVGEDVLLELGRRARVEVHVREGVVGQRVPSRAPQPQELLGLRSVGGLRIDEAVGRWRLRHRERAQDAFGDVEPRQSRRDRTVHGEVVESQSDLRPARDLLRALRMGAAGQRRDGEGQQDEAEERSHGSRRRQRESSSHGWAERRAYRVEGDRRWLAVVSRRPPSWDLAIQLRRRSRCQPVAANPARSMNDDAGSGTAATVSTRTLIW